MATDPGTFAAVFAALFAAHEVGDHWVQTHGQACGKGAPGWTGRRLCAAHVATLTATKGLAVLAVALVTGLGLSLLAAAAGLAVDAVSHYWADRRTTLERLADAVSEHKGGFYRSGHGRLAPTGTGAYALDQSWHIGWLLVAALLMSVGAS